MPARGRVKLAEAFRVGADFAKQPLHFALKTHAEFRRNPGIITNRSGKFLVRLGMKQMIHSPAILRARPRFFQRSTFNLPRFDFRDSAISFGFPRFRRAARP